MKLKIRIITTITILIFIGSVLYIMLSWITCPNPMALNAEATDMSNFVYYVWPLPQSKISSICYLKSRNNTPLQIRGRGISVEIHPMSFVDLEFSQQNNNSDQTFKERVFLYVDGTLVQNTSRIVFDDLVGIEIIKDGKKYLVPGISGGYIFSWTPFLLPGNHIAKIIIYTKAGEALEYQWDFLVW